MIESPPKTVLIYGMIDPRTNQLRYVGKTERSLEARLCGHINDKSSTYRGAWVRAVVKSGVIPDIFLIESVAYEFWCEAEQFWIAYFRAIGAKLVNASIGGVGQAGIKNTISMRLKKSNGMKGLKKSEEHKRKLALANVGKKLSEATRLKLSAIHKGRPASNKGKKMKCWTQESKDKHSKKMKGMNEGVPWSEARRAALATENRKWTHERRAKFIASMKKHYDAGWSPKYGNAKKP